MGLHDGLSQLLIDGVAGDHLVAVVGVHHDRQGRFRRPASVGTGGLKEKVKFCYNFFINLL